MKPATRRRISARWLGCSGRCRPAGPYCRLITKARRPALARLSCLCDAEPADHLHRGGLPDPFEDGVSHITEIVVLDEFRVCAPRVGLQVDTDRVDAGPRPSEARPRLDFAVLRAGPWCGTMMSEKTSRGNSEPARLNSSRTAQIDFARIHDRRERGNQRCLPPPPRRHCAPRRHLAIHGLHVCHSRRASGNRLRKAGTTFETPWVLSSGVPISTMSYSTRQRRTGDRQTQIQGPPHRPKSRNERRVLSRSTTRRNSGVPRLPAAGSRRK